MLRSDRVLPPGCVPRSGYGPWVDLCGFGVLPWPGGVLPAGFVGVGVAEEVPGLGDDDDGRGDGCGSADGDGCGPADGAGPADGGAEDRAWPVPWRPAEPGCWPGAVRAA